MWVPVANEPEYRLTIELTDGEDKSYTMDDIKTKFKQYKVTATLQCAGNRRNDMTRHAKQTNGLQLTAGAISNAEWEGVRLRDLLADAATEHFGITRRCPTRPIHGSGSVWSFHSYRQSD